MSIVAFFVAGALVSSGIPPVGFGQERTLESAHRFLADVFSKRPTINHSPALAYRGAACEGTITYQWADNGEDNVLVDFAKVSSVDHLNYRGSLQINGPFAFVRQSWTPNFAYLDVGSYEMAERVKVAINFIREQCDQSRSTGF